MQKKKPVHPCKKDCEYRSPHCHNETCPFGWMKYERELKEFDEQKKKELYLGVGESTLTAAKKVGSHAKTMRMKRKNQF